MLKSELEHYLHVHIPLSKAMAVSVLRVTVDEVVLAAPLLPNINHRETVFGGSASAVAILAAWSLLHCRLSRAVIHSRLIIQRNAMEYQHAITSDFTAIAELPENQDWQRFVVMLNRLGKARLMVNATLQKDGLPLGRSQGAFVALAI